MQSVIGLSCNEATTASSWGLIREWRHAKLIEMRTSKSEIPELIALSRSANPRDRRRALQALCPCEVKSNASDVWRRVMEMVDDPDVGVRRWVVHVLCDGSPGQYRAEIVKSLEARYNDPDERVRKFIRKALAGHRRSGTVNVL